MELRWASNECDSDASLRLSEERMRLKTAALESTADGVVITDLKGIDSMGQPGVYTIDWLFGGRSQWARIRVFSNPAINPECLYQDLWQTISSGQVWAGELINRRKDGELYHEAMTITSVRDKQGTVTHFVAIKQDITQRKRAEEALREKEHLLSEAQRLGHVGSWFHDMMGPMSWSEEMYRLYGVSPDTFTPTPGVLARP